MNPFDPKSEPWPAASAQDWLRLAGPEMESRIREAEAFQKTPPVCGRTRDCHFRVVRCQRTPWKLVGQEGSSREPFFQVANVGTPAEQIGAALVSWIESGVGTVGLHATTDVFRTIAMFRAFRMLAAGLAHDKSLEDLSIPGLRAIISGRSPQRGDSEANPEASDRLVRVTIESLAAILGTADELQIEEPGNDEEAGLSGHRVSALAEILREEARLGAVADPLSGSFHGEALTREFAQAAWAELPAEIRERADFSRVIELGAPAEGGRASFDPGFPGLPPFIRGPYPTMYLGRPWTIRQYAGFCTADETNAFFRNALADGQKGLSVAFDLPTHRGYDSDHARAYADVGKAGVAIDTVDDMKRLFEDIPLADVSVSMTMNGAVIPILAFFFVAAEEQGVDPGAVSGTIQNDILKEYMVRNTYIYPPEASMRIVADVMAWLAKNSPRFNSISVSGYHMHEAGATAGQELAYTLANGLAYLRAGREAGIDPDVLAARMSFFWAQGMDYMTEVAKLRAARGLWARLLWEEGVRDAKALAARCHCQTSGWSLTRQDPVNNLIRTTLEALSAVHGHTQSLHTNALDEAVALPSDAAAGMARHTQLLIQAESGICEVADPWGGSNEMESLTEDLANEALSLIEEIGDAGGMVAAISRGLPQRKIERAAARRQAQIDGGEEKIVGVNHLESGESTVPEVRRIDDQDVFQAQVENLEQVKARRDPDRLKGALERLRTAASNRSDNLLEFAIAAARERATVGEISAELESIYGRFEAEPRLTDGVYIKEMKSGEEAVEIEALRERVRGFERDHGRRPRLLVTKMGQDGHDRGAKIVAGGFSDFGFDVDLAPMFRTPDEVVRQALADDVHVIGISSLAGAHMVLVMDLLELLDGGDAGHIKVIVGGIIPDSDHEALRAAGVAAIFGPGSRLPDCANTVLDVLEDSGDS